MLFVDDDLAIGFLTLYCDEMFDPGDASLETSAV